jgi:hypothetical protein
MIALATAIISQTASQRDRVPFALGFVTADFRAAPRDIGI